MHTKWIEDFLSGLVLLGLSVWLVGWLIPAQIDDTGSQGLAPSLLPRLFAIVTGVASLLLLVQAWRARSGAAGQPGLARGDPLHLARVVAVFLGVVALLQFVGFAVAAPVAILAFTALLGPPLAWSSIVAAVLGPAAIWWLATYVFGIPLP